MKLSDIQKKLRRAKPLAGLYKQLSKEEKMQLGMRVALADKIIYLKESDHYKYGLLRVYEEIKHKLSKTAFSRSFSLEERQAAHDKLEVFELIEEALLQKIEEGQTARIKLQKDEELNAK